MESEDNRRVYARTCARIYAPTYVKMVWFDTTMYSQYEAPYCTLRRQMGCPHNGIARHIGDRAIGLSLLILARDAAEYDQGERTLVKPSTTASPLFDSHSSLPYRGVA